MIYELRVYTPHPGKLEALQARFRDHTRRIFARHGMESVGYWVQVSPAEGAGDLVYIVSHADRATADTNWTAFRADEEWMARKGESEQDGPLVAKITSQYLEPTDFSALR